MRGNGLRFIVPDRRIYFFPFVLPPMTPLNPSPPLFSFSFAGGAPLLGPASPLPGLVGSPVIVRSLGRRSSLSGTVGGGEARAALSLASRATPDIELRWLRLARSCVNRNFSSSSVQRMALSSRAFSRLGLSARSAKVDVVDGVATLFAK
jgi:hypothetical protein